MLFLQFLRYISRDNRYTWSYSNVLLAEYYVNLWVHLGRYPGVERIHPCNVGRYVVCPLTDHVIWNTARWPLKIIDAPGTRLTIYHSVHEADFCLIPRLYVAELPVCI